MTLVSLLNYIGFLMIIVGCVWLWLLVELKVGLAIGILLVGHLLLIQSVN